MYMIDGRHISDKGADGLSGAFGSGLGRVRYLT